jgi:hypothetical protein
MATGRGRGTGKPRRRRPPPRIHTRLTGDESPFGVSQAVISAWIDQRTADPHTYGCPTRSRAWAWEPMSGRMDRGYADLLRHVKGLLEPAGIMNPGRLGL